MAASLSPWTVIVTNNLRQEVARSTLRAGVPISIGRAPDCTITLQGMTVQRRHGRIELSTGGIPTYVADPNAPAEVDGDPVEGTTQLGERTLLELAGYSIRLERQRAAAAAPARPATAASPPSGEGTGELETLLDRHIQGVRMHRSTNQQDSQAKVAKFQQDWITVVNNLRAIKARYGSHPLILEFTVAKDDSEATIKLREQSARGYAYFMLSRQHPEGKFPNMLACWLREVGAPDASFEDPARALEDLISRMAPRLA